MNDVSSHPQGLSSDLGNSLDQRLSEVVITISSDEKLQNCASDQTVESGENSDLKRDWVCRICLSNSDSVSSTSRALSTKNDLIQLGCKCKGEIGLIHVHCAQDWFRTKGNSCCEICGDKVKNTDEWYIILDDHTEGTNTVIQATQTTRSEANTENTSTNRPVNATYREFCIRLVEFIIWIIVIGGIIAWGESTKSGQHYG